MLERIRHHRRLGTVVLMLVALAWLAALLAGAQVRQALAASHADALYEVCSAAPQAASGAPGSHHADPQCLLCLALGTPPALALAALRPPAPQTRRVPTGRTATVPVWRAQAPLPARGPPPAFHT
ncbi:DUF2946 family protein [Pulveribacter suum]|uniref:DUF2946 domain-containing protein n=1 Tax=Pulveribacter suum TaxID=2116657 RepID=A0A2P1NH49_9BURK|nr:DUF2946 family protein [Pulveribacter suum]AVP56374.1 hypothetical protein C7H73_00940 [Pulveribacter suum]